MAAGNELRTTAACWSGVRSGVFQGLNYLVPVNSKNLKNGPKSDIIRFPPQQFPEITRYFISFVFLLTLLLLLLLPSC